MSNYISPKGFQHSQKIYKCVLHKSVLITLLEDEKMANPIVAAIASFIIPGIGQIYAGDIKKRFNIPYNYHNILCYNAFHHWND